jgi:hypothetical protein
MADQNRNRPKLFCTPLLSGVERDLAREKLVGLAQSGWPPRRDRGGLRIKITRGGRRMLVDRFDRHSVFFGLKNIGGQLVGVWRITRKPCPLAAYRPYTPELPPFLQHDSVEATRLLLDPSLWGTGASLVLFRGVFEWCRDAEVKFLFTSAQIPKPASSFVKLGLEKATVGEFSFGPADPRPSCLLFIAVDRALDILDQVLPRPLAA